MKTNGRLKGGQPKEKANIRKREAFCPNCDTTVILENAKFNDNFCKICGEKLNEGNRTTGSR